MDLLDPLLTCFITEYDPKIPIVVKPTTPERRKRSNAFSDSMNLDDFRDRIYVHDLDQEIEDIESEDEKLIFLPDIEKHLTKIPASVLVGQNPPPSSNEVVLYGVPESLSVSPEQDLVRKAIAETRARAREKLQEPQPLEQGQHATTSSRRVMSLDHTNNQETILDDEYDAMDIG